MKLNTLQEEQMEVFDNSEIAPGFAEAVAKAPERLFVPTVPDALAALGAIYRERNKKYGNNYMHFGTTMAGIFPNGVTLKTAEDFNRFCIFIQVVSKFTRYGQTFAEGGHADSLDDTSVYAQMLREYDQLAAGGISAWLHGGSNGDQG